MQRVLLHSRGDIHNLSPAHVQQWRQDYEMERRDTNQHDAFAMISTRAIADMLGGSSGLCVLRKLCADECSVVHVAALEPLAVLQNEADELLGEHPAVFPGS